MGLANDMPEDRKILVIEDDRSTRAMIHSSLSALGYQIFEADDVEMGVHLFQAEKPDLIVVDLNLPDGTGLDVCKKVRAHKTHFSTPVIMLTVQGKIEDKEAGFGAGVDQYLVKPVHPKELLMWAQALLKRIQYDKEEGDELKAGDLVLDLKSHIVRFRDQVIPNLTMREYDLLYILVKKRPQVVSRKYVLTSLWHTVGVDHIVDTHLSNLRKKLPAEISNKIQNVPNKGFRYFE